MIFKSKEKKFWDFFVKNANALEEMLTSPNPDYSIYNALAQEIKKVHETLVPELTIDEQERFVIIITPDGIRQGIEPAKELVAAFPEMKRWIVKAFRQAGEKRDLNFQGISLSYEDIQLQVQKNAMSGLFDIVVLMKNYVEEDQRYLALAFLYLDHHLGELNVMTKVGEIEFGSLASENSISLKNLLEFKTILDESP